MQRLGVGQETPVSIGALPPATGVNDQPSAPPVGRVVAATLPSAAVATHSDAVGQATVPSPPGAIVSVADQAVAPAVGLVELIARPTSSVATHSEAVGHEMPSITW